MSARRAAALALLAVLGTLVAVPAASLGSASAAAAAPAVGSPGVAALAQNGTGGSNVSLGTHVSAFVTAGVETAGENVERGMWAAAYESTDNRSDRAALVAERTRDIDRHLADLEAEKRTLIRQRRSGEIEPVVFRARMSALAARLSELRASINDTAPRAAAVGVPDAVADLRRHARNASGPELRRARSIGGGPPGGAPPGRDGTPPGGPPGQDGTPPGQGDGGPGAGPPGSGDNPSDTPSGSDGTADRTGTPTDTPTEDCDSGPPGDPDGPPEDVPGEGPPDC